MSKVLQYLATAMDSVTEDDISTGLERSQALEHTEETGREFGVLTPYLVRLMVVLFQWAKETDALKERMSFLLEGTEEWAQLRGDLEAMMGKISIVRELFWAEIREEFQLWREDIGVGVRGEWKVVELLYPVCPGCGEKHPQAQVHSIGISVPREVLDLFAGLGEENEAANA